MAAFGLDSRIPQEMEILARVRASRASFLTWQSVRAAESTRLTKRGIVSMEERYLPADRCPLLDVCRRV